MFGCKKRSKVELKTLEFNNESTDVNILHFMDTCMYRDFQKYLHLLKIECAENAITAKTEAELRVQQGTYYAFEECSMIFEKMLDEIRSKTKK